MDFVALTEFFHESQCIFYFRLGCNAPSNALSYLSDKCQCPEKEEYNDIHVVYHKFGHWSSLRHLPQSILSKVEKLTVIDSVMYSIALHEFMAEIAWLESNSALGRRVLCDDVLKRLEPELTYFVGRNGQNINVMQLYMDEVDRRTY